MQFHKLTFPFLPPPPAKSSPVNSLYFALRANNFCTSVSTWSCWINFMKHESTTSDTLQKLPCNLWAKIHTHGAEDFSVFNRRKNWANLNDLKVCITFVAFAALASRTLFPCVSISAFNCIASLLSTDSVPPTIHTSNKNSYQNCVAPYLIMWFNLPVSLL